MRATPWGIGPHLCEKLVQQKQGRQVNWEGWSSHSFKARLNWQTIQNASMWEAPRKRGQWWVRTCSIIQICSPHCGYAWRCDTVQKRTAAARCRGVIQQGIFTTQTCCVNCSQRQGFTVSVLCHWHPGDLPADHTQLAYKHHRNKRERSAEWKYYILNAYAGRYARVSCNKQYVPHLLCSLFSERPEICTP